MDGLLDKLFSVLDGVSVAGVWAVGIFLSAVWLMGLWLFLVAVWGVLCGCFC